MTRPTIYRVMILQDSKRECITLRKTKRSAKAFIKEHASHIIHKWIEVGDSAEHPADEYCPTCIADGSAIRRADENIWCDGVICTNCGAIFSAMTTQPKPDRRD